MGQSYSQEAYDHWALNLILSLPPVTRVINEFTFQTSNILHSSTVTQQKKLHNKCIRAPLPVLGVTYPQHCLQHWIHCLHSQLAASAASTQSFPLGVHSTCQNSQAVPCKQHIASSVQSFVSWRRFSIAGFFLFTYTM